MWGSETLTTVVSSTSINVLSITAIAMIHGFIPEVTSVLSSNINYHFRRFTMQCFDSLGRAMSSVASEAERLLASIGRCLQNLADGHTHATMHE